jgi:hypothetical protein
MRKITNTRSSLTAPCSFFLLSWARMSWWMSPLVPRYILYIGTWRFESLDLHDKAGNRKHHQFIELLVLSADEYSSGIWLHLFFSWSESSWSFIPCLH